MNDRRKNEMNGDAIHIAVNGMEPAPQGSKRHVGGGRLIEASKRVKPWRQAVAVSAQQQMRDQKRELLTGACSVSVVFRFKRPKAHFTTNGQLKAAAPKHCIVKRNDIDKCCRSTLDALSDTVFADDCLVVSLNAEKRYCFGGEQPGALITVIGLQ
jgi:crossover junction endodeoxyribonuclease RusA